MGQKVYSIYCSSLVDTNKVINLGGWGSHTTQINKGFSLKRYGYYSHLSEKGGVSGKHYPSLYGI